ncbi:ClpP/crotonase [Saccharata proteae CBS 121410]|uniref:ClpP/crotonase n=1 Tax=Saccharata proteae CBS 121410 TaxID=1314787 RepID=A0A9P4LY18_9PEZI|nr:ClpP/crotonase [Saccharata proteae CBS 121410]
MPPSIKLPGSYASLPFTQIKLSHHPASSPAPTPVIVLTLHRPGKHNAFHPVMMEELEQAFQLLDLDDRVKCIVVTGHGKMFCAGADLEVGFVGGKERGNTHRDGGGRVVLAIHHCRKPVIGAINGAAVGVGITMTLPMTIRITHRAAKIGFVFARRGLVMEACSSFFLPRLIGYSRALHLVTTGAVYTADNKLFGDLFSEVVERPEDVLVKALEVADEVVGNCSSVSTYLMKELMYRDTGSAEAQHLLDSKILYELFEGSDNKEGVKSFLEKRPANFTGSMEKDAPSAYPWWNPIDVGNRPTVDDGRPKKARL